MIKLPIGVPIVVIYHGNCADGFGAAWVVRKFFAERFPEVPISFHAGVYGKPPPDVMEKDVVMVDFSYKRPVLEQMISDCESMVILDHHKTARDDLNMLVDEKLSLVFDMSRSGALIAWNYYFPDEPVLKLIQHISDRDLWQFKLPGTREIQAALFSYPYEFPVWSNLMEESPPNLRRDGEAIERKHHKDIAELLEVGTKWITINGQRIPVCNLPYTLASDACHKLCTDWPGVPYAASYYIKANAQCVFSLRSLDDGADVSAVAKSFGGGGHAHAAGFTIGQRLMMEEFEGTDDTTHPYKRKEEDAASSGESSTNT